MAGLLVSYSEVVEGTFAQVAEGEHFYCQGFLMVKETVDGNNTLQYTGDVERQRINLEDIVPVRILKDCQVRIDDGTIQESVPVVDEPPVDTE